MIKSEREYNWLFGLYYGDDFTEEVGVDDYDLGRVKTNAWACVMAQRDNGAWHVPNGEKKKSVWLQHGDLFLRVLWH